MRQQTTLRFSERTRAGWSEPRTVSSGKDWFITTADVPSVLRMKNGTLVANWYPTTDESIEAYDTYLSYSRDEGKTWAKPFSPHHDRTKTQHGFVSLLELADGGLGMVWLDGRDQEQNTTDPLGGSMALYFASFDSSWKQTAESIVNARVCECCQTAAVMTADGVLTAFRDRIGGRDPRRQGVSPRRRQSGARSSRFTTTTGRSMPARSTARP